MSLQYTLRRASPSLYEWLRGFKHPEARRIQREFERKHGRDLLGATKRVQASVESGHTQDEILQVIDAVLTSPPGLVVEAGCWLGASSAKLSLACAKAGKKLAVFDSFEGLPVNDEIHETNTDGAPIRFDGGDFAGPIDVVKGNVARFGDPSVVSYHKGWFSETMPSLNEPVCVAYVDVDLVLSTKDCLKYLYPLLVPGGVIFSQDGHVPKVIDLLRDDSFWRDEVGVEKPRMTGLGTDKLVRIHK